MVSQAELILRVITLWLAVMSFAGIVILAHGRGLPYSLGIGSWLMMVSAFLLMIAAVLLVVLVSCPCEDEYIIRVMQ